MKTKQTPIYGIARLFYRGDDDLAWFFTKRKDKYSVREMEASIFFRTKKEAQKFADFFNIKIEEVEK